MTTMRREADARSPDECCGALLARDGHVLHAMPLLNSAANPRTEYLISARDFLAAEAEATARDLTVIGFFHSHPSGTASPSARDLAEAVPGFVSVILCPHEITAWLDGQPMQLTSL